MAKKNRKPVDPVSLPKAAQYFHPRDWKDFTVKVEQEFDKVSRVKGPHPDPAVETRRQVAIRDTAMNYAHTESFNAFWLDIQKGKLILVGYLKPGDGRLLQIPNHALDDPNSSFDFKKAKISGSGLYFVNVGVLKAADAENVPEFSEAKEEQPERPDLPKASKGKPGPKPKWDWDAAAREMVTLAEKSGGLPWPKAKIVEHLAGWFSETYNEIPADSLLREHVGKWLPLDYHDRK